MEITIYNRTNQDVSEFEVLFQKISKQAEKVLKKSNCSISVTFCRSKTIHQINRQYRDKDQPTDVISFAMMDHEDIQVEDIFDLGDIFINIDYARKQAKQYQHSYQREIGFLFTHGLLHCFGYDHMNPEDEKKMIALQQKIIDPIMPRV